MGGLELGKFVDLMGELGKQEGLVFLRGVDTPMHNMRVSGAKFKEKLIFCFENDKNLVNFDLSSKKSKKFAL